MKKLNESLQIYSIWINVVEQFFVLNKTSVLLSTMRQQSLVKTGIIR